MSNQDRFAALADHLIGLGLLGAGGVLSQLDHVPPAGVRPFWRVPASDPDRQAAQALIDGWDWRPRRPKATQALLSEINGLSAANRQTLLNAAVAWLLQQEPTLARSLGLSLDGDEVVPG